MEILYIFYKEVVSAIMSLMHVAHNLGCGTLISPPESSSLDEGSHPSAAGPHNSSDQSVKLRVCATYKSVSFSM